MGRVHSFEPVQHLRESLVSGTGDLNLTTGGRIIWGKGLAAEDRHSWFRVWDTTPESENSGHVDQWSGTLEEVVLVDASWALAEVKRLEGRVPDLLYLNCEGCEYEVLQRLGSSGL